MADKETAPAGEPNFTVMLRSTARSPITFRDQPLLPGQQVEMPDIMLVDALLAHPASLISLRDGSELPREEAIRYLTERAKRERDDQVARRPRPSHTSGIVDPATDKGEAGPGLTVKEMVALHDDDLDLPPLDRATNKTQLQTFINKFKLGRPPLRATVAEIHDGLTNYVHTIRETRHAEKERALKCATDNLDTEREKLFAHQATPEEQEEDRRAAEARRAAVKKAEEDVLRQKAEAEARARAQEDADREKARLAEEAASQESAGEEGESQESTEEEGATAEGKARRPSRSRHK